eukprot:IDg19091t1
MQASNATRRAVPLRQSHFLYCTMCTWTPSCSTHDLYLLKYSTLQCARNTALARSIIHILSASHITSPASALPPCPRPHAQLQRVRTLSSNAHARTAPTRTHALRLSPPKRRRAAALAPRAR